VLLARLITGDSNDAIFIWRLPTVSVPPTSPVGVLADRSNLLPHASPPLPSSSRRMAWLLPDVPRPASSPPAPHQRADGNVAPAAVSSSAAGSPLRTSQASLSLRGSLDVGSALQVGTVHPPTSVERPNAPLIDIRSDEAPPRASRCYGCGIIPCTPLHVPVSPETSLCRQAPSTSCRRA
jgi:hypothetical protein